MKRRRSRDMKIQRSPPCSLSFPLLSSPLLSFLLSPPSFLFLFLLLFLPLLSSLLFSSSRRSQIYSKKTNRYGMEKKKKSKNEEEHACICNPIPSIPFHPSHPIPITHPIPSIPSHPSLPCPALPCPALPFLHSLPSSFSSFFILFLLHSLPSSFLLFFKYRSNNHFSSDDDDNTFEEVTAAVFPSLSSFSSFFIPSFQSFLHSVPSSFSSFFFSSFFILFLLLFHRFLCCSFLFEGLCAHGSFHIEP